MSEIAGMTDEVFDAFTTLALKCDDAKSSKAFSTILDEFYRLKYKADYKFYRHKPNFKFTLASSLVLPESDKLDPNESEDDRVLRQGSEVARKALEDTRNDLAGAVQAALKRGVNPYV